MCYKPFEENGRKMALNFLLAELMHNVYGRFHFVHLKWKLQVVIFLQLTTPPPPITVVGVILCLLYLFLRNLVWEYTQIIISVSSLWGKPLFNTRGKIIF